MRLRQTAVAYALLVNTGDRQGDLRHARIGHELGQSLVRGMPPPAPSPQATPRRTAGYSSRNFPCKGKASRFSNTRTRHPSREYKRVKAPRRRAVLQKSECLRPLSRPTAVSARQGAPRNSVRLKRPTDRDAFLSPSLFSASDAKSSVSTTAKGKGSSPKAIPSRMIF